MRYIKTFESNEDKFSINGMLELLKYLDYDVMYHEEHKEYFFEVFDNGVHKTVWLNDFSDLKLAEKKYNL